MDHGETIKEAVQREVLEETGVQCVFKGIIGFREQLNYRNGASDFYMVCLMVPANEEEIGIQIIDKLEVEVAQWVPIKDLSSNVEGQTNYKMHYNSYRFLECVNVWLSKGGKTDMICMNEGGMADKK